MDLATTILTALLTSLASAGVGWKIVGLWLDHRLQIDREKIKGELQERLQARKIELESEARKQIESLLADQAVERQYEFEARKRLYAAVGPLQFQLLMACRDACRRIEGMAISHYDVSLDRYYGKTLLYRLLRPLVIFDLIERQMTHFDFSVDSRFIKLLRYGQSAHAIWSDSPLVRGHSGLNMKNQREHAFKESIANAIAALVWNDDGAERCLRYPEFDKMLGSEHFFEKLDPFPKLVGNFSARSTPLLWVRMVAYANLCASVINEFGVDIGFTRRNLDVGALLEFGADSEVVTGLAMYVERCKVASHADL